MSHPIYQGIFLLLGTNLGNPLDNLEKAKQQIKKKVGKILKLSSIYKTAAWGNIAQPDFYNQVIEISTTLQPLELLEKILAIETSIGRKRNEKWGPRTIDIDILFFNQVIINTSSLILPHPHISDRKFTLIPLVEIAGELWHPVFQKNMRTLLSECTDVLPVEQLHESS